MKVFKSILVLFALSFFSCELDDGEIVPSPDPNSGLWYNAEKGYILNIKDEKTDLINVTNGGCAYYVPNFKPEDFGYRLEQKDSTILLRPSFSSIANIVFTAEETDEFCDVLSMEPNNDPMVNYNYFWNFFNDHYAFFELRSINWEEFSGFEDMVTETNFYDTLAAIVYQFEDGHITITDEANGIEINAGAPKLFTRLNANLSVDNKAANEEELVALIHLKLELIQQKYLSNKFKSSATTNMVYGMINDQIGYLNILEMDGFGTDINNEIAAVGKEMTAALTYLKSLGMSKLIIDTRFNTGGIDQVSVEIASRFTTEQRVGFTKKARLKEGFTPVKTVNFGPKGNEQFTGEIVLLTSPITASAAEVFALCLKDMPNVTLVGEATNGVFSDILEHRLPNGATIGLSNEVYTDSKGIVFEGVGIAPIQEEFLVPLLTDDDVQQQVDSGILKAIAILE
ncbi:S41 family peptidase [Croceivirga sp. JEA036]|uniref:S41 family peptidase n=1 Tax=Croceivirga sp. JEA036 TaxID=2721162 RepID=UPI00143884C8|nr:S41 family peptidase [Croceivirga sp. JEA036]NJB35682.1 S41 family peptidase [Croceivirga sp. JEA036]